MIVCKQRGATLVIALIVVALVVLLATRMGSDYLLLFRTVENQNTEQQSHAYLRATESLARESLLQDIRVDGSVDALPELWAQPRQLVLPEGSMQVCLLDLQSRLNLNDLGAVAGHYSPAQLRFIRLLQVVPVASMLNVNAAQALANAVFDWVDMDSLTRYPGGAENTQYQQRSPPYRAANQSFASITELRLVAGMTDELVAALTPYVSVWGNGNINFNTLDPALMWSQQNQLDADRVDPVLLRTLNNADTLLPLNKDMASQLANLRSSHGGFVDNLDFFHEDQYSQQNWDLDGVGINSGFFLLTADMQTGKRHYKLETVLQRSVGVTGIPFMKVTSRTYSNSSMNPETACAAFLP